MTLDSSNEVVAILYDIENAPFEMLNYTLGKARRYQPCRTIVVSDWEARPEQKRWEKLLRRPGFTFRQISRTYQGKNSLDSAIYDSAKLLYDEGVRRFFIITTDSDFVKIAEYLNSDTPSYIIGVGTKQASETLRNAYDEFMVYPPEEKKPGRKTKVAAKDEGKPEHKSVKKAAAVKEDKSAEVAKTTRKTKATKLVKEEKNTKTVKIATKPAKMVKGQETVALPEGHLTVKLPRTLHQSLQERQAAEGVSMDELVTYLLMRGMARWVED
ncbi:MAG: NYN domain-containing protein [Selenomonas sp.]|uniref:NYN domain-containing protein n=1 Tax=Selenomonas sp. TaxID=2053611 RepID=UPI0025F3E939|nr:NYN domain-containing protein [Selenomonas sp.]MCR5757927.1 NYN domain-containing protein [Selenomonas sp.]